VEAPSRDDPQFFNYVFSVVFGICLFMTLLLAIVYWIVKDTDSMSNTHLQMLIGFMASFAIISFLMVLGKSVHELRFRRLLRQPAPLGSEPILSFDSDSGELIINSNPGLDWP